MPGELQRYLGQFSITDSTKDFVVDGTPLALTTGTYYMSGSGDDQLVEEIEDLIQTVAGQGTATVTQSATTGKVTISLDSAVDITWTDAGLGTLLGFTGNLTGSDSYVSDNQARYCWFPSSGLSDYPGYLQDWWSPTSTTRLQRSPTGQTYSRQGNLLYDGAFEYQYLTEAEVWQKGGTWWDSFESFFEDVLHPGSPIRCFPDRDQNGATDYQVAIWQPEEGQPIGSLRGFTSRNLSEYNGFWRVTLSLWKHVT